jgi:2-oxoisovalerate dehydrogenase E1 component alpha subunit
MRQNKSPSTSKLSVAPMIKQGGKKNFRLAPSQLVKIHDLMIKARCLEERLIRMYKQSHGYFWLGGPGEEAFSVPLGLQVKKGKGLNYDFLHMHYRAGPVMLAMGLDPADSMRQMKNSASDPFSGGRNFASHYSIRDWNVVPVTSTIETQYLTAIGSGIAQRRNILKKKGDGITIVTGGDAGTAEGDFASALVWSSRPDFELPMLMIVTNNGVGISTPACTQHGEKHVADRGKAFGIKSVTFNGNDVDESWAQLKEAMEYVRTECKPLLLEAIVSRLYGHSSATGANFNPDEEDPIVTFESQLLSNDILSRKEMDQIREKHTEELLALSQKIITEPLPDGSTIYDHTYWQQKGRTW